MNNAGTIHFMPPESHDSKSISKGYSGKAADIWALAVTFYAFTFLELPFFEDDIEKTLKTIKTKKYRIIFLI